MKRREDHALQKHTFNLYYGDFARMQAIHSSRIGASKVIRDLVRAHILKVEGDAAQNMRKIEQDELISDLGVQLAEEG